MFVVFQPTDIGIPVLTLTTTGRDGETSSRVLARIEDDEALYVSANHWPRTWYYRALDNPDVQVTIDGETRDYVALPVVGDERERRIAESKFPFVARLLTGFPPHAFLRLEPR